METYILNSAACLALLLLFYKLLLENETMHFFKRFYLLGSLFIAFIIPLITFTTYLDVESKSMNLGSEGLVVISEAVSTSSIDWSFLLWVVYGVGVLIFSIKFSRNLLNMIMRIKQNPKFKNKGFINVLLRDNVAPHTFFSYLFFNSDKYLNKQIPQEVIVHEEAHAKQLHSLDILIVEILQVLFWFNPLIYLAKNAIKLNHEFLADQSVIKVGIETSQYQRTLLAFSSNAEASNLANAFNYSSIKKRFTVMKTQTSKRTAWSKGLLLLPLLAVLLYSFSTKELVERDASYKNTEITELSQYKNSLIQDIATKKMVEEYNALAKKYNEMDPGEMKVLRKEVERMHFIYNKMSSEQKKKAHRFPEIIQPPAPPAPPAPPVAKAPKEAKPTKAPKGTHQVEIEMFEMDGDSSKMPPPPPPVPVEHMKELAKEGAIFYLEGKKISAEEAIELVNSKKMLTIDVRKLDKEPPMVKLSTKLIKRN
jgi:hypothetical protein